MELPAASGAIDYSCPPIGYGVDGCRAGWFYFGLQATGEWRCGVLPSLGDLVAAARANASVSDRVFVDIPIGLPDGAEGRECDRLARAALSPKRHSSVFPAPVRTGLDAANYADARRLSLAATGGRKSVGSQTYGIIPKIREVDALMRENDKARRIVREVHPEVCFWALNSGEPMAHSKKAARGRAERVALLDALLPGAATAIADAADAYPRKDAAVDDTVDAMACAATALAGELRTMPERPAADSAGLRMEMVYALPEALPRGMRGLRKGDFR